MCKLLCGLWQLIGGVGLGVLLTLWVSSRMDDGWADGEDDSEYRM